MAWRLNIRSRTPRAVQSPEGWVLKDRNDSMAMFLLLVLGALAWTGGSIFAFFAAQGGVKGVAGVFLAAGVVIVFITIRRLGVVRHWHAGELVLPDWPLGLGREISVRFRRRARGRAVIDVFSVSAELLLKEVATYQAGTNTHTVEQVVGKRQLVVGLTSIPGSVAADISVPMPESWPPTISLPNNRVEWWVRIDVQEVDDSKFQLHIAPRITA